MSKDNKEQDMDNSFDSLFATASQFEGKLAKIKCIGVGGGGGNAINRMVDAGIDNVEFIAVNTDAQDLGRNKAHRLVQVGETLTKGLGVGGKPELGRAAAEESIEQLKLMIADTDLLFITAGMGGGTGTGVAPIIAKIAKETYGDNILVVGVVTRPFNFEGYRRADIADKGIKEIQKYADSMLIVPNEKLFDNIDSRTTREEAFKMVDDVLLQAVRGIAQVIIRPGEMNIDYNDLKAIMLHSGRSLIGTGAAKGQGRHLEAAKQALNSPLLENADITGAKGFLVCFSAPDDITMPEIGEVMNIIRQYSSNESSVKFGHIRDTSLPEGTFCVTIIVTGFAMEGAPHLTSRMSLSSPVRGFQDNNMRANSQRKPLPISPQRVVSRTPRPADIFDSRSDFMLIPACIRRRKEGK